MKILLLEKYPFLHREYLDSLVQAGHELIEYGVNSYVPIEIEATLSNIHRIDAEFLDSFPNLRYVLRTGVGLDMIDVDACKSRGIEVRNTPGANASSVADLALWGIIGLLRKTYKTFATLQDGFSFYGKELSECRVGILGFGNIGREIYKRIIGFGVTHFDVYDPYWTQEQLTQYPHTHKAQTASEIYQKCDVVVFTLPLTPETRYILSQKDFSLLKLDVVLVNVARGGIIEEAGLIDFLRSNPDAGAYLDVWEAEPLPPNPTLKALPNCIITPHIGAMTKNAYKRMHTFGQLI